MPNGIIYCITNTVNGHRYIGQTVQALNVRWRAHKAEANRGSEYAIHRAMRKYGYDRFEVKPVITVDQSILDKDLQILDRLEMFFINHYQTRTWHKQGYNSAPGGHNLGHGKDNPNYGRKHTEEELAKLSAAKTGAKNPNFGKPAHPNVRAAVSKRFKGKPLSIEHRARIAAARVSLNPTPKALAKRRWKEKVRNGCRREEV